MFIQTRCLYVVGSDRQNSQKIYSSLDNLGLINKLFSKSEDSIDAIHGFLQLLPDQTVFSKKVANVEKDSTGYYISLPLFSSHLKMPVKCGEYIWVYPYESSSQLYSAFSINSYWVSRVHGLDHSEDANFTFNDRDFISNFSSKRLSKDFEEEKESRARKKKVLKAYKSDQKNNIVKPSINFGESTFELDKREIEYLENNLSSYTNNCVPKITNQSEDLLVQGSNNTFIKMTSDGVDVYGSYARNAAGSGEIKIVSGPGKYSKGYEYSKSGLFINQKGQKYLDSPYNLLVSSDSPSPTKLIHEKENFEENIKNVNLYSLENIEKNRKDEGAFDILDDSSKILVSENANYNNVLNDNFDIYLNLSSFSLEKMTFGIPSSLLSEEDLTFNINNFQNNYANISDFNMPSISLISNSINTFSRMGAGSISFIKEYFSYDLERQLNSYIRLDKDGNIYIDGNRIFIGSESLEKEKGTFENGKGTIVNIGLGEESQSLVLGEQLKEYIQEMIYVNREDMDLTKKLFEEVKNTQADMDSNTFAELEFALNGTVQSLLGESASIIGAAGPASGAVTQILATINSLVTDLLSAINSANSANLDRLQKLSDEIVLSKLKKDEELSSRMLKISDNIDKILSKISKTS
jgi:hypothetical protein